jgi:serine/threonine protein kinase
MAEANVPTAGDAGASPTEAARRLLGERYTLGEVIGRGGMATVYRAHDEHLGRPVAVKIFQPGIDLVDAGPRHRREVTLLATLRDPGLISVLDADLEAAEPYLVTELVDGPTLSQRIKGGGPLPDDQVARLGATLCQTLAYVHRHGIVHRDVKPANILLAASDDDPLGQPKLVDFGIAIAAEATRLTSVGVTLGTANYISPEQLRGTEITPATDIYSLGLVLIEALTGRPAYPGTGIEAAMSRLTRPPEIPPSVGQGLRAVLAEMTASDPAARPEAEHAGRRLGELASSDLAPSWVTQVVPLAEADDAVNSPDDITTAQQRRARAVAVAAVVIVALAGIAAVASFTGRKSPGPLDQSPPAATATAGRPSPAKLRTGHQSNSAPAAPTPVVASRSSQPNPPVRPGPSGIRATRASAPAGSAGPSTPATTLTTAPSTTTTGSSSSAPVSSSEPASTPPSTTSSSTPPNPPPTS